MPWNKDQLNTPSRFTDYCLLEITHTKQPLDRAVHGGDIAAVTVKNPGADKRPRARRAPDQPGKMWRAAWIESSRPNYNSRI